MTTLILQARAPGLFKARFRLGSTRKERLRDSTLTRVIQITGFCAPPTASSLRSMCPAQAQDLSEHFRQGINAPGMVTESTSDPSDVNHGFVRGKDGAITTFDVPGAGTGPGQGTIPLSNNPADEITGYYIDASNVTHGFLGLRRPLIGRLPSTLCANPYT